MSELSLGEFNAASEAISRGEPVEPRVRRVLERASSKHDEAPPWEPVEERGAKLPPPVLIFRSVGEVLAEVDAAPRPTFLARPVWPSDAYGVLGALWKAGKTWLVLDLVIAVLTGGEWLGHYPVERQGPVLMFLGEGGPRKMTRRLRAIAGFYGVAGLGELPLRMCFRSPHLTNAQHLQSVAAELKEHKPVLVILDPLYLAARGAQGSQLYEMGEVLEALQSLCQSAGAALLVAHHFNRQGGSGSSRLSGAGPAEWGRVLITAERKAEHTDLETLETAVTLELEFIGDEIPETTLRIRRKVSAIDPDDLSSPLIYSVEVLAPGETADDRNDLPPATRRVLAAIAAADDWVDSRNIGDRVAADETGLGGLKRRTIQAATKTLADGEYVESRGAGGAGGGFQWRVMRDQPEKAENAL
jgi:hypothetical protein